MQQQPQQLGDEQQAIRNATTQQERQLARMASVTSGMYNSNPVGSTEPLYEKKAEGFALWKSRMKGLMAKRIIYTKRKYILFVVMVRKKIKIPNPANNLIFLNSPSFRGSLP